MNVTLYTTPTCPWCRKVKELLQQENMPFQEVDVSSDDKARQKLVELSGQMGVPVLDIDGNIIIGYEPNGIRNALGK